MKRSRIKALVNLPLRDKRDQNFTTSLNNDENETKIKEEIVDIKEETILCEPLSNIPPKVEFLENEPDVKAILQAEDKLLDSKDKIEDSEASETSSNDEDEDETYHPGRSSKKIATNKNLCSSLQRPRKCHKVAEETPAEKPTTMFDLIYERIPKAVRDKKNMGIAKRKRRTKKSAAEKKTPEDVPLQNEDPSSLGKLDSLYKTAPNYRNRSDLDSAGRRLDVDSTVNDRGQILNKNNSLRSYYCKNKHAKIWSDEETKNFYKALSIYGSDFSLMRLAFPNRTISELKTKFKKEDKLNRSLVEDAVYKQFCSEEQVVKTIAKRPVDIRKKKQLRASDELSQKPIKELKDVWLELKKNDVTQKNDSDTVAKASKANQKSLDDNNTVLIKLEDELYYSQEIKSESTTETDKVQKEETVTDQVVNELYLPEPKTVVDKVEDMKVSIKFVERDPLELTDVIQLSDCEN